MRVTVVTPPGPLLTAAQVRERLGIAAGDDSDATLDVLVAAAQEMIDGPSGWLGRALGEQTLCASAAYFVDPCRMWMGDGRDWQDIKLPCPPVRAVTSVTYLDVAGTRQTVDPATYALRGERDVVPALNASWPSARIEPDAVQVTYVAGYQNGNVPARAIQAIVLGVAQLRASSGPNALIKSDAVTGLGSQTFAAPSEFAPAYERAVGSLLANLRVID